MSGSGWAGRGEAAGMLGSEPGMRLGEGLRRTVDYYREYGEHHR